MNTLEVINLELDRLHKRLEYLGSLFAVSPAKESLDREIAWVEKSIEKFHIDLRENL